MIWVAFVLSLVVHILAPVAWLRVHRDVQQWRKDREQRQTHPIA